MISISLGSIHYALLIYVIDFVCVREINARGKSLCVGGYFGETGLGCS